MTKFPMVATYTPFSAKLMYVQRCNHRVEQQAPEESPWGQQRQSRHTAGLKAVCSMRAARVSVRWKCTRLTL
jgi:hypothetical protein